MMSIPAGSPEENRTNMQGGELAACDTRVYTQDECPKPCPTCEIERAARHHEVLCLVLKEIVRGHVQFQTTWKPSEVREVACAVADSVYPPPKAEGT